MKKIDKAFTIIYLYIIPTIMSLTLIDSAWAYYGFLNDKWGEIWLNVGCVFAVVWIGGILVNRIWSISVSILNKNKKKGEEHNE